MTMENFDFGELAATQHQTNQKAKFLSPKQLAEILGVKVSWLAHNRMSDNVIPYQKFGRQVRYDLADVLDWASKQKHK